MTTDGQDGQEFAGEIAAAIADLVPDFLDGRRRDVVAISAAAERGDLEAVRALGHDMKGSGGGYGFDRITQFGAALEAAAAHGRVDEIRAQNAQLQRYLYHLLIANS